MHALNVFFLTIFKKRLHLLFGLFLVFLFCSSSKTSSGSSFYGIHISEAILQKKAEGALNANPILSHRFDKDMTSFGFPRKVKNKDFNFLFCIGLLLFLGIIKKVHPLYFRNLFRAFGNATLSNRQLKEQIQQTYLPGLLLDLFFYFSAAMFLYQASQLIHLKLRLTTIRPESIIIGLALCIAFIYIWKYTFLKMAGWLFQIPEIMNNYSFNVFLFNRILGILLLPFVIVLSFGTGIWVQVLFSVSLIVILSLYIFRFIRSRQVFTYFLNFSKFHFILYLCASELIPVAVLAKLIILRLTY